MKSLLLIPAACALVLVSCTPGGMTGPMVWSFQDFVDHFTMLHKEYYEKKGKKKPNVHAIGYAIDEAGGKFLKAFVKKYDGKYRRVGRVVKK